MSGGFWAFFWLMVVMKLPVGALLWLVWWAVRAQPEPEVEHGDGGGGPRRERDPRIRPPRSPRRGPHGEPLPRSPERVRVARGRPHVPAGHR